jgi:hypothetical protein
MLISKTQIRSKWFSFKVDKESAERLPDDAEGDSVEPIKICLKYLKAGELDSLQDRRLKTNVRRSTAVVESDFRYSDFAARKRALAVVDWEGIIDEETGEKLAITPANMKYLPAWLSEWMIETIDAMTQLEEEELGE